MAGSVVAELIRALLDHLEDPTADHEGWDALAMVLEFPGGRFNSAHGYLYLPAGRIAAVAADPWAVQAAVTAYTDSCYEPGDVLPRAILLQFDRATGRYDVHFEETDGNRWNATPRTYRQLREELRPRPDAGGAPTGPGDRRGS
ncbi:hypothetical protein [Nakamurella sp.]|uniref:hypothetical protein n=1 Tax=Nakamurella sp. TaxID=1869182 RepID=UPI003B3B7F09